MKFRRIVGTLFALLVVGGGLFAATHFRDIEDWLRLRGYQPSGTISTFVVQTTMTDKARHIFYVNRPVLESDKNAFNGRCNNQEQTIVLGCYHGNQRGIYIYNVEDARLAGVEEVTAAHEMLHAAYDRLSAAKRQEVDTLLQDYYGHDLHDQRILQTIDSYKKTEPNDVVNEMHSIFGTEVATLPAALEDYYKAYFTDRQKVVAYSAAYQSEFTTRRAQVAADDQKLAAMKQNVEAQEVALDQKQQLIAQQKAELDAQRAAGHVETYNAGVAPFNALVVEYNAQVAALQRLIAEYNALVAERNTVALEEQSLVQALDSRTAPMATQ